MLLIIHISPTSFTISWHWQFTLRLCHDLIKSIISLLSKFESVLLCCCQLSFPCESSQPSSIPFTSRPSPLHIHPYLSHSLHPLTTTMVLSQGGIVYHTRLYCPPLWHNDIMLGSNHDRLSLLNYCYEITSQRIWRYDMKRETFTPIYL